MEKRYIVQKRELEEHEGKKARLSGAYKIVYSDVKPPFDLSDKEKVEARLLRAYGEGRYQVKYVEKDDKGEKVTTHFTGDVEKYKPRSKVWTKEERVAFLRETWRTPKEKLFILPLFFFLFLIAAWLFIYTLGPTLDPTIIVASLVVMLVVFLAAAFFIDLMFFETE